MAKLKPQEKEKIKEVQEIEAQLRASANKASSLVSSWLGDSDDDSDENEGESGSGKVKAREVFKGRPARLGVGAKFLSHKEMMASQVGSGILTADELKLKRKLTGRLAAGNSKSNGKDENKQTTDPTVDSEDDGDSRSKMVSAKGAGGRNGSEHNSKKTKRTNAFLDSLVKRRKR
ncbi:hypothetical protein GGI12_005729 [Dipsacomyces acuminosporus]|nr:hypothetical protein GGI12_005729 [Dipsacomyces acuminosporus]